MVSILPLGKIATLSLVCPESQSRHGELGEGDESVNLKKLLLLTAKWYATAVSHGF